VSTCCFLVLMCFVFFFVDKFKKFWTPSFAPASQTPQSPTVKLHSSLLVAPSSPLNQHISSKQRLCVRVQKLALLASADAAAIIYRTSHASYAVRAKIEKRIEYFCPSQFATCLVSAIIVRKANAPYITSLLRSRSVQFLLPFHHCDSEMGAEMVPSLSSSSSSPKPPPYMAENRGFAMLLPMPSPK
jgi:hypothetical protein